MAAKRTIDVPDGAGGWMKAEVDAVHEGGRANSTKQVEAMGQAFIEEAGTLTEKLMQFDQVYLRDMGLGKEHRAFAAALYCVNLREGYPDGSEAFDKIAAAAGAYWDANHHKVKG